MRSLLVVAALLSASLAQAQSTPPATAAQAAPATAAQAAPTTAAPSANAQGAAPGGAEARARLVAADANKDGKWDKTEWLAAGRRERGFEMMDADTDGFVTQAELKDGMAKLQARRATPQ